MMWFKVITPATVSTPYYSLSYVNSNVKTVTKTETLHDGSTKTYYTSVITGGDYNAIEFLPAEVAKTSNFFWQPAEGEAVAGPTKHALIQEAEAVAAGICWEVER